MSDLPRRLSRRAPLSPSHAHRITCAVACPSHHMPIASHAHRIACPSHRMPIASYAHRITCPSHHMGHRIACPSHRMPIASHAHRIACPSHRMPIASYAHRITCPSHHMLRRNTHRTCTVLESCTICLIHLIFYLQSSAPQASSAAAPPQPSRPPSWDINVERTCSNKGCGAKYREIDNSDGACKHHPGPAVFRDRKRGWQCCGVFVNDFDEFIAVPPCATGWHSDEV
ncbi:unnamed protein product [Closterium sp. NIES-65]|nr:unnamed protein product [Closterium sp. NIES-65]